LWRGTISKTQTEEKRFLVSVTCLKEEKEEGKRKADDQKVSLLLRLSQFSSVQNT
jgi:hypothetical protein